MRQFPPWQADQKQAVKEGRQTSDPKPAAKPKERGQVPLERRKEADRLATVRRWHKSAGSKAKGHLTDHLGDLDIGGDGQDRGCPPV